MKRLLLLSLLAAVCSPSSAAEEKKKKQPYLTPHLLNTTFEAAKPGDFVPPFVSDYSRFDWRLCQKNAFCFASDTCRNPTENPKKLEVLTGDAQLHPETKNCSVGVMIVPVTPRRWVFHVQAMLPELDPDYGIRLGVYEYQVSGAAYIPSNGDFKLGHCTYDWNYEPTFDKDEIQGAVTEGTLVDGRLGSYGSMDRMLCAFSIESKPDNITDVPDLIKNTLTVRGPGRSASKLATPHCRDPIGVAIHDTKPCPIRTPWSLAVSVKKLNTGKEVRVGTDPEHKDKKSPTQNVHLETKIIDEIVKQKNKRTPANMMIPLIPKDSQRDATKRDFLLTNVNTDYGRLGCDNPHARLILKRPKSLHEVTMDTYLESPKNYVVEYYNKTASKGEPMDVKWKVDDQLEIACATKNCVRCSSLPPPPLDCDGCTPPTVVPATHHKDCSTLRCPSNTWMLDDGGYQEVYSYEKNGIFCKMQGGKLVWTRTNGAGVARAACAPSANCALVSPLNDTCKGGDDCVKMRITGRKATCANKDTLLYVNGTLFNDTRTLHCDARMGTWYAIERPELEINHTLPFKCELHPAPVSVKDDLTIAVALFVSIGGMTVTLLFIGLYAFFHAKMQVARSKEKPKVDIMKRPRSRVPPEYTDLTLIKNLILLGEEQFRTIIRDWQLYSLNERMLFLDNVLAELGSKVDIDQFLAIFNHCVENGEVDHRIWRKLFVGFKMIMIALNQVNRSRSGLRLNEHLKKAACRIMERIGDWPAHGEDESTTRLRSMLFIILLATNSKDTILKIREESQMFLDQEDPRRRAVIFAYKMRAGDKQEDRRKQWDAAGGTDMKKEDASLNKLIEKYGGWREHWIYAMCTGRDPDTVTLILIKIIEGEFMPREILAGFRACVEDFFDMRVGAREAFKLYHKRLKERVPVGTPEYNEIFEMFMRYACLDFTGEDNWLVKFVFAAGSYSSEEKNRLPLATMAQCGENGRELLKKAMKFTYANRLGHFEDLAESEMTSGEGGEGGMEKTGPETKTGPDTNKSKSEGVKTGLSSSVVQPETDPAVAAATAAALSAASTAAADDQTSVAGSNGSGSKPSL